MSKTAWFNNDVLPTAMLNSGFKSLKQSDHFASLEKSMSMAEGNKLLDLGCGIAEVAATFPLYEYTGADLPHIINNAARQNNPNSNFISFDANNDSYNFMQDYDIILMNSFISEIPDWYKCLSNVLCNAKKYVIIHRQEVTQKQSYLREYVTYAGLQTTNSIINHNQLHKMFYFNQFKILFETNSFPNNQNQKTFLLRKSQND